MLEVKKEITEEEIILLDEEVKLIPLTYDKMFKGIFKERLDILKLFILCQLELDIDPSECKIELLDSELPKISKREYQKTVDLYVKIDKIYVNIEVNREYFKNINKRNLMYADRLYSLVLEQGENTDELDNRFFIPWKERYQMRDCCENDELSFHLSEDSHLEIYLSAKCNQNCEYCYLIKNKGLYPEELVLIIFTL